VYPVIALPPVAGAVNVTPTLAFPVYDCPLATDALPIVGASGLVVIATLALDPDTADPLAFVAVTVNV